MYISELLSCNAFIIHFFLSLLLSLYSKIQRHKLFLLWDSALKLICVGQVEGFSVCRLLRFMGLLEKNYLLRWRAGGFLGDRMTDVWINLCVDWNRESRTQRTFNRCSEDQNGFVQWHWSMSVWNFSLAALNKKDRSRDVGLLRGTDFIEQALKESLLRPTLLLFSWVFCTTTANDDIANRIKERAEN